LRPLDPVEACSHAVVVEHVSAMGTDYDANADEPDEQE